MKKLLNLMLMSVVLSTPTYANSEFSIADEVQQEVQAWISLFDRMRMIQIDFTKYPSELSMFNESHLNKLDTMMALIENAEVKHFEKKDYSYEIKEFTRLESEIISIKKIMDAYVEFTNSDDELIGYNRQAILDMELKKRIHKTTFDVIVGNTHTKEDTTIRLFGDMKVYTYPNLDEPVYFLNDKLYRIGERQEHKVRNFIYFKNKNG